MHPAFMGAMSDAAEAGPRVGHEDACPPRVLAVDDEPAIAELLSAALSRRGWAVRTTATGSDAIRPAQEFRPDAVLLDMRLPDMDGLQVLRRLRADRPLLPVMFLTARGSVADRVAALTAGGDDYVTKPCSLEEVAARLLALVRRTSGAWAENELLVGGDPAAGAAAVRS